MDPIKMLKDLRDEADRINVAIAAVERHIREGANAMDQQCPAPLFEVVKTDQVLAKGFLASPAMSYLAVPDGGSSMTFINVNEAFQRLTGYRRDEVIGRSTVDLGLWADQDEQKTAMDDFRTAGRISDFEYRFRRKDGRIRNGLMAADTVELAGRMVAVVSSIDITERKRRAEETLKRALGVLAHAVVWTNKPPRSGSDMQ